jgi:hypothetical protein
MAGPDSDREDENLRAPTRLIEALKSAPKERLFVPPAVDEAVLRTSRAHLKNCESRSFGGKSWISWAAMAACLMLGASLGHRYLQPPQRGPFDRADLNRDGRVDILDAFVLAEKIETGVFLDPGWDINRDGRVDRADVNAIAARAVSVAQSSPHRRAAVENPSVAGGMRLLAEPITAPPSPPHDVFSVRRPPHRGADFQSAASGVGSRAFGTCGPTSQLAGAPLMKCARQILALSAAVAGAVLAQPASSDANVRYCAVDIVIDSRGNPLAAYQCEFFVKTGSAKVVGVEGSKHPAFKDAPFYDPAAIQHERVILAAFTTTSADKLPVGKTRVATVHLQITGERNPGYAVKLETAATLEGRKIAVETTYEERKPR